jgi:hypothetical protein
MYVLFLPETHIPAGAAAGCDLLILIFEKSKDRSLRQLLH